eukprot:scaffold9797_cov90-Isochrysis_galbana.AAC.2
MAALVDVPLMGPSVVEYCAAAVLAPGEPPSLVLTRGTVLEFYSVAITRAPAAGSAATGRRDRGANGTGAGRGALATASLRLRLREDLAGRALGVESVRLRGSDCDSLLVSVHPSTLCVLELDQLSGSLRTRATLGFDALAGELGCLDTPLPTRLRTEPAGQVALLLAFSSVLIAVPLSPGSAAFTGGVIVAEAKSGHTGAQDEAAAAAARAAHAANAAAAGAAIGESATSMAAAVAAAATLANAASTAAAQAEASDGGGCTGGGAATAAGEAGLPPPWWRLGLCDVGLQHAIDTGFLENKTTPTALVLADPNQTWPGRHDQR